MMNLEIQAYNDTQAPDVREICDQLAKTIDQELDPAEGKIWHSHPVWFLGGNPIVGYSIQKAGCRLMFWSGSSFEEEQLNIKGKKFKDASVFYTAVEQIVDEDLRRWLKKAKQIQWDYKNIVKRKGVLERLP